MKIRFSRSHALVQNRICLQAGKVGPGFTPQLHENALTVVPFEIMTLEKTANFDGHAYYEVIWRLRGTFEKNDSNFVSGHESSALTFFQNSHEMSVYSDKICRFFVMDSFHAIHSLARESSLFIGGEVNLLRRGRLIVIDASSKVAIQKAATFLMNMLEESWFLCCDQYKRNERSISQFIPRSACAMSERIETSFHFIRNT